MSDEDLEAALDGLISAVNYCSENGLDDLSERAAALYQDLGEQSPDEHWEDVTDEERKDILGEKDD